MGAGRAGIMDARERDSIKGHAGRWFMNRLGPTIFLFLFCLKTPSQISHFSANRVDTLLSEMTLAEKIGQMVQINDFDGRIPDDLRKRLQEGRIGSMLNETDPETSLEIQRIAMHESRLGIPLLMARDVIHGFRTIFPIPLGQAATWDPALIQSCAQVAAEEAAAAGFHWTFAPMMDVTRDPRWGRIAEGFGEDPFLASMLAVAMIRGFQGSDLSGRSTFAACAKHFAGYGAVEGGRDYDSAFIPEDLLRNVYLPPFHAAVQVGVASVMTSFNEINGVPSSGNPWILRRILRKEWGFRGLVVSDWRSMAEMMDHGFCEDLQQVAAVAVNAGVDMEMQSQAYERHLERLVQTGAVSTTLIDDAVRNILSVKERLGLLDEDYIYRAGPVDPPDEHKLSLAKAAAMKSVVLLKNDSRTLPLSREIRSVAVIGPLANDPYEVLGTWNRDGRIGDTVTPLAAVQAMTGAGKVRFAEGLAYSRDRRSLGFIKAVEMAEKSEAVLFFGGEEAILSGEAHSRARLNLPGVQEELITVLTETGKPVILIVLAGRPLCIGEIADKVQAVLYAWHPGTMTGPALADLIFGIESPSGKLPVTFPKTEGQIPVYYAHKNTGRPPRSRDLTLMDDIPLRAYQSSLGDAARYLDIGYKPLYPFGYGLSYTAFDYSDLNCSERSVATGDSLQISVTISNRGPMEADEIVQLYIRDLVGCRTRPVKELKGFRKIRLKPGEAKPVCFNLNTRSLGFYRNGEYIVEPGRFLFWVGGHSTEGLQGVFELNSKTEEERP